MSDIVHFKKFSYVYPNFRVEISLDRLSKQFSDAQDWLGDVVLKDCKPYMPLGESGGLRQRSHVEDRGTTVVFPGPYARFQYGGVVMVDPDTGSPWTREGRTKVTTNRKLTYSQPQATDHWFDTAKARHGEYWIEGVKKRAGGGK